MDRSVKDPRTDLGWYVVGGAAGAGLTASSYATLAMQAAAPFDGQQVPWNPSATTLGLLTGQLHWTPIASIAAAGLLIFTGLAAWRVWHWWRIRTRRSSRQDVDSQARWMGRGDRIDGLTEAAAAAKATELEAALKDSDAPGVSLGQAVVDGRELMATYEDLHLDIWGPRQGKSTCRVIPAVMNAPGAVVTTSNKRDVVDATRGHRATVGDVWIFDPQNVAGARPTWFWCPLRWVRGTSTEPLDDIDIYPRAIELAAHFSSGDGGDEARKDPFFDPEGEDLLAGLLLAGALAGEPVTQVYRWVCAEHDTRPIEILDAAGYSVVAAGMSSHYTAPSKQRGGVFSTAKKMAACLKMPGTVPWVTPPAKGGDRREFTAREFVATTDTVYLLSVEGKGSAAGPLVTALAAAICAAGTELASRSPRGRMPVPMLAVLDEAANIVKWRELPALYSHFGSRGIIVMTILQSYAQGARCWGPDGMKALWSAANHRCLGSGMADADFLRDLESLIGEHYEKSTSVSGSSAGRSKSTQRQAVKTLTISDLMALPRGRAVLLSSGFPAVLIRTIPWSQRPYADAVRASLAEFDPQPAPEPTAPAPAPRLRLVKPNDDEEKSA